MKLSRNKLTKIKKSKSQSLRNKGKKKRTGGGRSLRRRRKVYDLKRRSLKNYRGGATKGAKMDQTLRIQNQTAWEIVKYFWPFLNEYLLWSTGRIILSIDTRSIRWLDWAYRKFIAKLRSNKDVTEFTKQFKGLKNYKNILEKLGEGHRLRNWIQGRLNRIHCARALKM